MNNKRTCATCPFFAGYGWCNFCQCEVVAEVDECPARRAYRVLRAEVIRLRGEVEELQWILVDEYDRRVELS